MIFVFVEGTYTLRVDYQALEWLISLWIFDLDWLIPYPETLRAWVYSWAYSKAMFVLLPEDNTIE